MVNKKNVVLIFLIQMNIFVCSGITFEEFVGKFRLVEWSDLDSLRRITMGDLKNSADKVPLHMEEANQYIWDYREDLPHANRNGNPYPSPHVRMKNGAFRSYMNYYLGRFNFDSGLYYDEKEDTMKFSGECSELYALGRIEIGKDIVMLVFGYKYVEELPTYFVYSTDVYIINKKTRRFVSAFCLSGHNPAYTILYDDYRITSYESYDTMEDVITDRYVYKIASDGFLTEISEEKNIPEFTWKTVVDSDGYVNVRNNPNVKSEILYTIPDKTQVLCHQLKDSNWVEVIEIKGSNRIGGYVHNSRLK